MILERLKDGRYSVGARMPTENELSTHFNVSRVTIRKALDILVQDGYVERKQGSGYTVLTLSPASDTCLTSFTDAMLRAGRDPVSRFISLKHFKTGAREIKHMPTDLLDQPITRITRLRMVDDVPHMLVMTYVPSIYIANAHARDFPERGPDQSILRILSARFNLEWSAACEDISPISADDSIASQLDVSTGHPLLLQSCSAFDDEGTMVFHEDAYRSGSVSFNLTRQTRTPRY